MTGRSKIEWTETTWNPVTGCDIVSPGCKNCYAKTFAERFRGVKGHPYEQGFDLKLWPDRLDLPLHWRKPRRVFVNSMSDLFHEQVPDEFIARVFGRMSSTPHHTYQILTKRPERMLDFLSRCGDKEGLGWITHDGTPPERAYNGNGIIVGDHKRWPLPNVWLGVSVESQTFAEKRIPLLLQTPAAVRWVSCEPLLGPVDFMIQSGQGDDYYTHDLLRGAFRADGCNEPLLGPRLDWVVVGGESGPGARPFDVAWARSTVQQCRAAGVPVFVKQLGAHVYWNGIQGGGIALWPSDANVEDQANGMFRKYLNNRKGGDPSEWPSDLRVREWPK
jgi:protein gp37